jgi:hypothetical protein
VDIRVPRSDSISAKPLGDSLEVHAFVDDDKGVVEVSFLGFERRGDPAFGTDTVVVRFQEKTFDLSAARDTVVRRFLIATPDTTRDTAVVYVTATDAAGNVGFDSVRVILGGPDVALLNLEAGQSIQAGLTLSLRARAFDPTGLNRVQIQLSGQVNETLTRLVDPPSLDTVVFDTVVAIPPTARGTLNVTARGRNGQGLEGLDGPVPLTVVEGTAGDTISPTVRLSVSVADFLELQDSAVVIVAGSDDDQGTGVTVIGYTILATSAHRGDTIISDQVTFSSGRTGVLSREFNVAIPKVDSLTLPDTLRYEVHGFMIDAAGNCGAAVDGSNTRVACTTIEGFNVALNRGGLAEEFSVVAGRTVLLPNGGTIMDAVVDTLRRNLMMSNFDRDQIEIFRLQSEEFLSPVLVGSEPWGLAMNRPPGGIHPDSLLVANSGGTNVTKIYLGPETGEGPFREDTQGRLLTPDVSLFNIAIVDTDVGTKFLVDEYNFLSDRPSFVAVDSVQRIHYSTRRTETGQAATIRKAFIPRELDPATPGLRPEVQLMMDYLTTEQITAQTGTALYNADNVTNHLVTDPDVSAGGVGYFTDEVKIWDHLIGTTPAPATWVSSATTDFNSFFKADNLLAALATAQAAAVGNLPPDATGLYKGFDYRWGGNFVFQNVSLSDTTFVASSGDGGFVVFAEGPPELTGAVVMMYEAGSDRFSSIREVEDLVANKAEVVRGVGLNQDGTLGVGRGNSFAFFFTTDLRLQGVANLPAQGAGATFHPLHANARSLLNVSGEYRPDTHLAFLGTGNRTIEIVDTYHFFLSGQIFIRDNLVGPLRAVLPFAEDNEGLTCASVDVTNKVGQFIGEAIDIFVGDDELQPHPADGVTPTEDRCIVMKLFGITDSGGVLVVDVRKSDILRNHPARRFN